MLPTLISWKSTSKILFSDEVPTIQAVFCHLILKITKTDDAMALLNAGSLTYDNLNKRFLKYGVKTFAYDAADMLHPYFKGKLNERFQS